MLKHFVGCRAGDNCPYLHVNSSELASPAQDAYAASLSQGSTSKDKASPEDVTPNMQNLTITSTVTGELSHTSKATRTAVQRPISKTEDQNPREFQLNQLRRRFRPTEETDECATFLTFQMVPSDPDFPFELESLHCTLRVPISYPTRGRPTLRITNPEMDRLYQENVEMGFDDIVDTSLRSNGNGSGSGKGSLLGWMNGLDRHLERFLSVTERGPTLKFVANIGAGGTGGVNSPREVQEPLTGSPDQHQKAVPVRDTSVVAERLSKPTAPSRPAYTAEERAQAEKRRNVETKQLEARLGRLPLFQKSTNEHGISFTIPLQPAKLDRLPIPLRSVRTVKLFVPLLYPLEPSSVEIQGVDRQAALPVETAFVHWFRENSKLNLMSQVNYLASNMHTFNKPLSNEPSEQTSAGKRLPPTAYEPEKQQQQQQQPNPTGQEPIEELDDRSHLHVIPRPPEWNIPAETSDSDEEITDESQSEDDDDDDDDDDEFLSGEGEATGGVPVPEISEKQIGRGIALSFPSLELYGVELLDLVSLCITVKCSRCKESVDINNVRQAVGTEGTYMPKVERCKKCTNSMSIGEFFSPFIYIPYG